MNNENEIPCGDGFLQQEAELEQFRQDAEQTIVDNELKSRIRTVVLDQCTPGETVKDVEQKVGRIFSTMRGFPPNDLVSGLTKELKPWELDLSEEEVAQKKADVDAGISIKYDDDKIPFFQMLPSVWITRLGEVLQYGRGKYAMHNWKGLTPERLMDSAMRHLLAVQRGYEKDGHVLSRDSESQLYHIHQAATCFLMAAHNAENDSHILPVSESPI